MSRPLEHDSGADPPAVTGDWHPWGGASRMAQAIGRKLLAGYRKSLFPVSRREYNRVKAQRDNLLARLEADPIRSTAAALDGFRNLWAEEQRQCHRILDWIGVASDDLALCERVRILALELATRQGYSLDEAERLAPPAFEESASV